MTLKVILHQDDSGDYTAEVPALKGCYSQGRTRQEALSNVRHAIERWLESEQGNSGPTSGSEELELSIGAARQGCQRKQSIIEILRSSPGGRMFKTSEEVEDYLREERDSWER